MSNIVVKAENISKQYRLGVVSGKSLSEDVKRLIYKLSGKADPLAAISEVNDRTIKGGSEYVWALKNIDFEVNRGEVMGIIGRNGAGKSTLLKILSRVTTPTTGTIKAKGRIASLLEVGTGFHPELTGRENVFLNGAVLGMSKSEIKRKFDEIVEFSGVARYIDTPVKRYSSGMYVRLAFAVAAHLEPEILIIDEVLAVGDSEFQKKCLGKMKEVAGGGRTVLFVSHNMGAVSDICHKAILIEKGEVTKSGEANEVIAHYVNQTLHYDLTKADTLKDPEFRRGNGEIRFKNISLQNADHTDQNEYYPGDHVKIKCSCTVQQPVDELFFLFALRSSLSRETVASTGRISIKPNGNEFEFVVELPDLNLHQGVYETYYWLGSSSNELPYDVVDNLTAPLVVKMPENQLWLPSGYFTLDSKLIQ